MREEVEKASNFLTVIMKNGLINMESPLNFNKNQLVDNFKNAINKVLYFHYQEHWFPTNPNKGSGYRCIRINHKLDPLISKAGIECGLTENYLQNIFPSEFTMWVDPNEVSYRIGEQGSICNLFKKCTNQNQYKPADQPRKSSPPMKCERVNQHAEFSENDSNGTCSPMSISPPTPGYKIISTCNDEFRFKNSDFPTDRGNLPLVCCQLN